MTHSTHFIYGYMVKDHSGRKEGNILFNHALDTFYLRLCGKGPFRKEGNVLFNDALNTFYLRLYGKGPFRKEMFYLTTHSTHFIYGYMVKDHSGRKEGNVLFNDAHILFTVIWRRTYGKGPLR